MNRLENIANYAKRKEEEQLAHENLISNQIENCKLEIMSLKPRIDRLLEAGNACLKYNIPLEIEDTYQSYERHQFITNSWSHLLGFVRERNAPFVMLGIMGGGACNFNLITDGEYIEVSGDTLYVLKKFINDFDRFESEFYSYIDNLTA